MHHQRSIRVVGSLLTVGFALGCGGEEPTQTQPEVLSAASGSGQSADVGQALANPIVASVTQGGNAVSGASIAWVVTSGGGSLSAATSTTDGVGMASTNWTLGPAAGANTVTASGSGMQGSPVTFTATGVALGPPPSTAGIAVGDNFYDPDSQRLAVGGTVTWTWAGAIDHSVSLAGGADSGVQTTGTFVQTFATAGTFAYQCSVHGASMSGTIVVE